MNYGDLKQQAQSAGYLGGAPVQPPSAPGLEQASDTVSRLGKQLSQVIETLSHKHAMIYGPMPKAVGNDAKGYSGLVAELNSLSDLAEQVSQLANSL